MHQSTSFSHKKSKHFLERGTAPFFDPYPNKEGILLPISHPLSAPLHSDPGYATVP